MFEFIWHDLLYLPLYNLLIFFYSISPGQDMGLAVIFFTVFIRVILLPFSIRAARSEHRLDRLRPRIDQLKHRYRHDIEKQREAVKKLLSQNKIGVFSNFISLVFQVLVFVVLYTIFSSGLQEIGKNVIYSWNLHPDIIDPNFFTWFNLIIPDQTLSLVAAGVVLLSQGVRKIPNMGEASAIDRALLIGLPLGTYAASIILPSAKALFIASSVVFTMWIRFVKWIVVKYAIKDEQLKKNVDDLWTS